MTSPSFAVALEAETFNAKYLKAHGKLPECKLLWEAGFQRGEVEAYTHILLFQKKDLPPSIISWLERQIENSKKFYINPPDVELTEGEDPFFKMV